MKKLAILAGVRTPFTRAGGELADLGAADLGTIAARELLARTRIDTAAIDEVIFGACGPGSDEANVARVIALRAGLPPAIPACTVQRNCASGFEALSAAFDRTRASRGSLFLVGGAESMSHYPLIYGPEMTRLFTHLARARGPAARLAALAAFRPRFLTPRIALREGLSDAWTGELMGTTAENLAQEFHISREAQDALALESHRRASRAEAEGRFAEEIVPVFQPGPAGAPRHEDRDSGIRHEQNRTALARLRPVFDRRHGTVTVGNACQVSDGAVALLVAGEARTRELSIEPLAWLLDHTYIGLHPSRMGLGPVFATAELLARHGLLLGDLAHIELNEAFAAQVLACRAASASRAFARRELGRDEALGELDPERCNPQGGAIALGHPVGATGARLVLSLALQLRRTGGGLGLATLCVGGGQGGALLLEVS